ncbi:hypothetical protein RCOM_1399320 [Ricinus communis]|uniref:tRNA ligase phosphodiesterase domain-containing protein n=1 Tax=Ricinus communis TaxID=3988 RepID=B9SK27_RICCO|nr:hypothetical protein RCOM_1399320 [Ricinus communis]
MPQRRQQWKPKPSQDGETSNSSQSSSTMAAVTNRIGGLSIGETVEQSDGQKLIWKPRSYGTVSGAVEVENVVPKSNVNLSQLFKGNLLENFTVDNSTYAQAQIRATFYPKFENEKSDQEIRIRMIEMVSKDLATVEVTLKHSGSLFMYAGHKGGAYAKNSFGNIYTAVGVFVLGRMFREAWGAAAARKQAEFNEFLERNRMCISMELVTAVLGDHGQLVVTAVTELGNGKPKFYSTPEVIAFCRKWRLPTNHVWLFSTRKSVTSFFAAYDALCEEGTATTVCSALDEVAVISVPGSKDHIKVQGEILEGLVARIVSHDSSKHMNEVLREYPPPPAEGAELDLGPSLREICAANRTDEKQLRTFLIRNGLSILSKDGPSAYKAYYLRQMKIWGTSAGKQRELSKMLDEWAAYIRRKYGKKQLSSSTYLSEVEPFLEQFASRNPENQALIGSAGSLVRAEDVLAIIGGREEEGDLETEREAGPPSPISLVKDTVQKNEGLIVFFPGIPGCAKSTLCKELLNAPGGLGDDRPIHSLMGDLVKGRYWQKVADECRRKPYSIMLADKNAPNEEVWRQIEDMCRRTQASAVPVVPDSEGTDINPFSLDALSVFIFRVLQRVNHPGNLDKASPNAGYVLLMFYHLYDGKSRKEFESELIERFGSLVKMPLLKSNRSPLPDPVRSILEEGINLYRLHTNRHGRLESTKGSYAKEWASWEKRLREVLLGNTEHLSSILSILYLVCSEVHLWVEGEC